MRLTCERYLFQFFRKSVSKNSSETSAIVLPIALLLFSYGFLCVVNLRLIKDKQKEVSQISW